MFTNFTILFLELNNEYSKNAIIVPEALAEKLFPLMKEYMGAYSRSFTVFS